MSGKPQDSKDPNDQTTDTNTQSVPSSTKQGSFASKPTDPRFLRGKKNGPDIEPPDSDSEEESDDESTNAPQDNEPNDPDQSLGRSNRPR